MYATFGMPKSSASKRMTDSLKKVDPYEKDSGNIHIDLRISKKMLDGVETVTFSISKCGASTQEFTSVESFTENLKTIVSGLKAKL